MVPVTLCCALCVTILSSTAALLYIAYGNYEEDLSSWGFCETPRGTDPWISQPVNASTSIAFVVVGLLMAAACDYQLPKTYWREPTNQNLLTQNKAYGTLWSSLLCLMGPSTTAFHSSFTFFGTNLDQSMILLNASFIAVYSALRKRRYLSFIFFFMSFLILATPLLVFTFVKHSNPSIDPEGTALMLLLAVTAGLEVFYKIAGKIQSTSSSNAFFSCILGVSNDNADLRFIWASLACLALGLTVLFLSTEEGKPLCFPDSAFQGHGLWHVISAIGLGFVFVYQLSVNEETWLIDNDNDDDDDDENAEEVLAIKVENKL